MLLSHSLAFARTQRLASPSKCQSDARTDVCLWPTRIVALERIAFPVRFRRISIDMPPWGALFEGNLVGRRGAAGELLRGRPCSISNPAECIASEKMHVPGSVFLNRHAFRIVFVFITAAYGVFAVDCRRVLAASGILDAGMKVIGWDAELRRATWVKFLQVLKVFKEQGFILAVLLGLSAFFSMAETSITTLWPWKVRELAEKDPENGAFKMLSNDVTRFLTTILIGTTVVNIGATALVTEAATAIFGEAGVSAATGVMTVLILLFTEITPKSIAVHSAADVVKLIVRPVALLSLVLYPVGRVATYLSVGMLKMLGLKGTSEPDVTEDELKLMLRGAELSGAIEEEEQDMIENVLEIKDTYLREVMTPLVDVVAINACAKLVDFKKLWEQYQYSRVPVFEERVDNIVGIIYAMDLLKFVEKGEKLQESTVIEVARMPAYFVPDSMSVWNLLREFRIRKVHMAVVLNEYGGTVGIVTLEDVVEEIVGEIFDENDSKEEIKKKSGYIVTREDGTFDVDASTSIYHLSEELNVRLPEGHLYETVSGFVCKSFGYIPAVGGRTLVVLEKANLEENHEYTEEQEGPLENEKRLTFELEILEADARKVGKVRFKPLHNAVSGSETTGIQRLLSTKVIKRKKPGNGEPENNIPKLTPDEGLEGGNRPQLYSFSNGLDYSPSYNNQDCSNS